MQMCKRTSQLWTLALLAAAACSPVGSKMECFGDGLCILDDGQRVLPDGAPIADYTTGGNGSDDDDGGVGPLPDGAPVTDDDPPPPAACTLCAEVANDSDDDCLPDSVETATNPNNPDSDADGVTDGCEDQDRDGTVDSGELNPTLTDTDGDGIPDGVEDANKNGRCDFGTETCGTKADTDNDGTPDGVEDADRDGVVDPWVDVNGDGCFSIGVDTTGETDPRRLDSDRDNIPDNVEDRDGDGGCIAGSSFDETCAWLVDTDCDGLGDGLEDTNHNGLFNSGETDPLAFDTDGDGLCDGPWGGSSPSTAPCGGGEDANKNGAFDVGLETDPRSVDSDGDGLFDNEEDLNLNGVVDGGQDLNGDGCFDAGLCPDVNATPTARETDPRRADSDCDGLLDGQEDFNRDGLCNTQDVPNPLTGGLIKRFAETCAQFVDSDCDGLPDGTEDSNRSGARDPGESDPRSPDTDYDGLTDGCPAGADVLTCEDRNNNGRMESNETSPVSPDTDGDFLTDGCEVTFGQATWPATCTVPCGNTTVCGTCPRSEDTDGDGENDEEEDVNRNCVVDPAETDPRLLDPPPTAPKDIAKHLVCSTANLKHISFATTPRLTHDYRVVFEVEPTPTACNADGTCSRAEDVCINGICQATYFTQPYGLDSDGDNQSGSDLEIDLDDELWGHVFQSPGNVKDPGFVQALTREVYGFTYVREDTRAQLDDILDEVRDRMQVEFPKVTGQAAGAVENPSTPSRPAHDDSSTFRINRAQRTFDVELATSERAVLLRNRMLENVFLVPDGKLASASVDTQPPLPVGDIAFAGQPPPYKRFTVHIAAVHRLQQAGPSSGDPVVIFAVALTPDKSALPAPGPQLHADSVTRLEDLTGGSGIARFEAENSKLCESFRPRKALADVLWVVDDSASMQQLIGRLQQAAEDARAVFTANSSIVDLRLAMTTTNRSPAARIGCLDECGADCTSGASCDQNSCVDRNVHLGCIKLCPPGCATSGGETNGVRVNCSGCATGDDVCSGSCLNICPQGCTPSCTPSPTCAGADLTQCGVGCVDRAAYEAYLATTDATTYPLPGGGGTFYFEDSRLLDCDSGEDPDVRFVDSCYNLSGGELDAFYGALGAPVRLTSHGRFLGSPCAGKSSQATCEAVAGCAWDTGIGSCNPVCPSAPMDLSFQADNAAIPQSVCQPGSSFCCDRLTASCEDGPTVLASQMCDLIRAMGGLPSSSLIGIVPGIDPDASGSSSRRHSAPEMGSRSARRLIEQMLPALPRDYAGPLDPDQHLRLDCYANPAGAACTDDSDCADSEACVGSLCLRRCAADGECNGFDFCAPACSQHTSSGACEGASGCQWDFNTGNCTGTCLPSGNCLACDPRDPPLGLSGNSCPGGLDTECERGEACSDGGACIADADCGSGEKCVGSICRRACAVDGDCGTGGSCDTGPGACNPKCVVDCQGGMAPLVTIVLSDEEDFYFKDDCAVQTGLGAPTPSQATADETQLPEACRYVDGDPSTLEPCNATYCTSQGFLMDEPFGYDPDGVSPMEPDPDGLGPDGVGRGTVSGFTLPWRPNCNAFNPDCSAGFLNNLPGPDPDCTAEPGCTWDGGSSACVIDSAALSAACAATPGCTWSGSLCRDTNLECSPFLADAATSCVGDPCPHLVNQALCEGEYAFCEWAGNRCVHRCARHTDCSINVDGSCNASGCAACSAVPGCTWNTNTLTCVNNGTQLAAQENACNADAECRFERALVRGIQCQNIGGFTVCQQGQRNACVLDVLPNDCQPCKRFTRLQRAVNGEPGLVGFGDVGPVYSIVREKGEQGFANITTGLPADECDGFETITLTRGDGQAYRDMAIGTLGRTQNICAANYRDFMQLLTADIAALSAPFPLAGTPIATTLKLGLYRPPTPETNALCGGFASEAACDAIEVCEWDGTGCEPRYFFEVPRSQTQGFIYNATTNSVGFKSDPIDGRCDLDHDGDNDECTADGEIEDSEVQYAISAPHVPREDDTIYVSYRFWRSVPCEGGCLAGECCVRRVCALDPTPQACSVPGDCTQNGYTCTNNECQPDCAVGQLFETCEPCPACATCEVFDSTPDPAVCAVRTDETSCEALSTCDWSQTLRSCVPDYCQPVQLANGCACDCPAGAAVCDPNSPVNSCPPGQVCDESCCCIPQQGCSAGFNPDGTVGNCDAALACCGQWANEAANCATATSQGACNAITTCQWNVGASRCDSLNTPCCPNAGEVPECFQDQESGQNRLFCAPDLCSCEEIAGEVCIDDIDCNTGTGDPTPWFQECRETPPGSGAKLCTPACNPANTFCSVQAGCQCLPTGG